MWRRCGAWVALATMVLVSVSCSKQSQGSDSPQETLVAAADPTTLPAGGGGAATPESETTTSDAVPQEEPTAPATAPGSSPSSPSIGRPTLPPIATAVAEEPTVAPTSEPGPEPARLAAGRATLRRSVSGGSNCDFEVAVSNEGSGRAEELEVVVTIENLRGPGAPDHVTYGPASLRGPSELDPGATETYLLDELTMQQGDVWVYDGTLHAAGADDVSFDDGGVAITCDG